MKLKGILTSLVMIVLLSGCEIVGLSKNNCSWVSPIFLDDKDVLTPGTAKSILLHNETWVDVCK